MGPDLFVQIVDMFAPVKTPITVETKAEALASIAPQLPNLRTTVLAHIRSTGKHGATCDEIGQALNLPHQTVSPRVHELMKASRVVAIGKRPTRSGRNAAIWVEAP